MIQDIEISKLHPHRNNPRKDLGDLTELTESIKVSGILQNLTVIPWYSQITGVGCDDPKQQEEMGYIVVIGHRRLAAAKLAGLTVVPCIISKMSEKEQVATMLLENMQRNDLTIYEQAQGFQMMLNFGDSIDDIATATGFSKTTVKHRVRLIELDQEKFKKSMERGATLQDYIELEKIKDSKRRNKVLEEIGTSNFKWKLDQALDEETKPERKKALIAVLNEFAKPNPAKSSNGLSCVKYFNGFKMDNFKKPNDVKTAEYYYTVEPNAISLYKKEPKAPPKKLTAAEKDFKKREEQLKDLTAKAYEFRYAFIKNFSEAKKYVKSLQVALVKGLMDYGRAEPNDMLKLLDIEKPADSKAYLDANEAFGMISDLFARQPEYVMLIVAYCRLNDSKTNKYYYAQNWANSIVHEKNGKLDVIYDLLIELGYELSDEERALRDGTHELFVKGETK